jgi:5'-3' exonuclease
MPEVHLVDATYELFRAWFGAPPRKAPDGAEVGAVRALLASMIVLLRDEGATHVGCATDHVVRSFRNDLWAGYKTDEGIDPDLYAQFALAEEGLAALGFVVWPMVEFEADDALATAAARFAPEASRVWLCTVDKDLAQCVRGDRIVLRDRRRERTLDEAAVAEKFGVLPHQIADFLALVGDSADGYPGLPGFGEKSAAAVLRAFGALETIPDAGASWPKGIRGAERLASTLHERRDEARLFKTLATLRLDAPVTESLDQLAWQGARPAFRDFCARLGFPDLASRVTRWRDADGDPQ